ncbi:hypothetical protein TCA2_4536 [Paenibacillus sp. TCA20]|nr:hypothetical protein TCA2_4536 [Paenibacillus sp. TCA20]
MDIGYKDYIPPSMFGMNVNFFVILDDGTEITLEDAKSAGRGIRKLVVKPVDSILLNHNYTVVVDGVKNADGDALEEPSVSVISTEFSPLYAKPVELRPLLRQLMSYFTVYELYVALRDAGQKAHQLQDMIIDANNNRYDLLEERDTSYYPTQKFVVYEAAINLLSSLLVTVMDQQNIGNPNETISVNGGDEVQLGDFRIVPGGSSSTTSSGNSSATVPINLIKQTLETLSGDHKFWMDAMMGRNKRGYATPVSASMKVNNGATPDDRGLE